jgi:hypothetical protein
MLPSSSSQPSLLLLILLLPILPPPPCFICITSQNDVGLLQCALMQAS